MAIFVTETIWFLFMCFMAGNETVTSKAELRSGRLEIKIVPIVLNHEFVRKFLRNHSVSGFPFIFRSEVSQYMLFENRTCQFPFLTFPAPPQFQLWLMNNFPTFFSHLSPLSLRVCWQSKPKKTDCQIKMQMFVLIPIPLSIRLFLPSFTVRIVCTRLRLPVHILHIFRAVGLFVSQYSSSFVLIR